MRALLRLCTKLNKVQVQLILLVSILLIVSGYSYLPVIFHDQITWHENLNLASDFSAFYNGVWSFVHEGSHLYGRSNFPVPYGQAYVYAPWFLLFMLPFSIFAFPRAEMLFALVQFVLLPVLAFLVILLLKPKDQVSYFITAFVLEITLLEPFDNRYQILPQIANFLPLLFLLPLLPFFLAQAWQHVRARSFYIYIVNAFNIALFLLFGKHNYLVPNYNITATPYWTLFLLGQSKILELVLIVLALYLARKYPILSQAQFCFLALSIRDLR